MTARWIRDLEVLELGPDALDWCRTQPDYATAPELPR